MVWTPNRPIHTDHEVMNYFIGFKKAVITSIEGVFGFILLSKGSFKPKYDMNLTCFIVR